MLSLEDRRCYTAESQIMTPCVTEQGGMYAARWLVTMMQLAGNVGFIRPSYLWLIILVISVFGQFNGLELRRKYI